MDVGLFLRIRVAPFVDFATLEEVLVLAADQQNVSKEKKPAK